VVGRSAWPTGNNNATQVLHRSFELPLSLFQHVCKFIPWPRMWDVLLPMLHKRCHIDPNEAIRGALGVMDEILTDLRVSSDPVQEMHLVRVARTPALLDVLRSQHKMPPDILDALENWHNVQSVLARFDRGVTFVSIVADRVREPVAEPSACSARPDGVLCPSTGREGCCAAVRLGEVRWRGPGLQSRPRHRHG
jgi:hypothetical protein